MIGVIIGFVGRLIHWFVWFRFVVFSYIVCLGLSFLRLGLVGYVIEFWFVLLVWVFLVGFDLLLMILLLLILFCDCVCLVFSLILRFVLLIGIVGFCLGFDFAGVVGLLLVVVS